MGNATRGFLDFETYGWDPGEEVRPLCCGFAWGDSRNPETEWFYDPTILGANTLAEKVLKYCHAREDIGEWWAHNLGRFDGLFLSAAAHRMGWEQSAIVAGGSRVIEWTFIPPEGERSVVFADSFALVPSSLKTATEDFELQARKLFTVDNYKGDMRQLTPKQLQDGCLADCIAGLQLLDKVETLITDWGGTMKRTFSSSALSIIRSKLNDIGVKLPTFKNRQRFNDVSRRAYYGARVEVLHHTPDYWLSEYDVNSSYPAAMTKTLPWEPIDFFSGQDAEEKYAQGEEGVFLARVEVDKDEYLPCLPYKLPCGECLKKGQVNSCDHARTSSVFFPTGFWYGWYPANELRYAETQGVKVDIRECALYDSASPFAGFINDVYALKATSKGALRSFTKFLLNGAYGKFGQKPEHDSFRTFTSKDALREAAWNNPGQVSIISEESNAVAIKGYRWPGHTHYALASYITAGARIALHQYLKASQNPVYCDADSIHCALGSIADIHCNATLGALKLEVPKYKGTFYAPKIYWLTEDNGKLHFACKGFPVPPKELPPEERVKAFQALVNRENISKGRMRLAKSQLRIDATRVMRVEDNKTWKGHSMKRRPLANGETLPWTVGQLHRGDYKDALSPAAGRGQYAFQWDGSAPI